MVVKKKVVVKATVRRSPAKKSVSAKVTKKRVVKALKVVKKVQTAEAKKKKATKK